MIIHFGSFSLSMQTFCLQALCLSDTLGIAKSSPVFNTFIYIYRIYILRVQLLLLLLFFLCLCCICRLLLYIIYIYINKCALELDSVKASGF